MEPRTVGDGDTIEIRKGSVRAPECVFDRRGEQR